MNSHSTIFVFILLSTLSMLKPAIGNRRGWGGGNRGGTGWKQGGGGGFNNWRQQSFKHPVNTNRYIVHNNNNYADRPLIISFVKKPVVEYITSPETVVETPVETSCAIPSMGDSTKFELRCIFPNSEQIEDCAKAGSFLPSNTSTILRCRPPYVNQEKDLRIWVCENGIWKGEFKGFTCVHPSLPTLPQPEETKYQTPQQNGFLTPSNSWGSPPAQESPSPIIQSLLPKLDGLLEKISDALVSPAEEEIGTDSSVLPPWSKTKDKGKPSSGSSGSGTTTPPTTTTSSTTTPAPYVQLPSADNSWEEYYGQEKETQTSSNAVKCPSLSKRTGVQLECLSKTGVAGDTTSFLISQSDCSTPQIVSTEATYKCEQYYEASAGLTVAYRKCKEDGTWSGGASRFSCALECGKSNPVGRIPLITNGEPTYKGQFPWHAALFYQDVRKSQAHEYICGATLINRKTLLTAGHCITQAFSNSVKPMNQFRIDLGRYERTVEDEFVQTFFAKDIILHPSYNALTFDSDIAIIILQEKVTVGYHVRPICYPQTQNSAFEELQLSDGSFGTVVGFGKDETGELSDILHMAKLKVVSQQECTDSFSDTNYGASLTKSTTFCAGLKNGTNVCSGDSGGGIYFPVSSGGVSRWYLQGIVSVGITAQDGSNRCDPTRFSVFTRISPYADWIVRVLSERDAL